MRVHAFVATNMASSKAALKKKKYGMVMQFPRHVVISLNREDRLRKQKLENLEKETQRRLARINREQKAAYVKLRDMQTKLLSFRNENQSMQEQVAKEKATATLFTSKSLIVAGEDKDNYSFNGQSGKDLQASSGKNGAKMGKSAAERNGEHSGLKEKVASQQ